MAYVTDDLIIEHFKSFKSDFVLSDLLSNVRKTAVAMIHRRAGCKFIQESRTIYVDGEGNDTIFITDSPIVAINTIRVLYHNTKQSETLNINQLDPDRQVYFDLKTGMIKLLKPLISANIGIQNPDNVSVEGFGTGKWPDDFSNIEISVDFGVTDSDIADILETLQLFIMTDLMQKVEPRIYGKGDIVAEKIGKYQYEFYSKSQTKSIRKTLGQFIDDMFDMLPSDSHQLGAI